MAFKSLTLSLACSLIVISAFAQDSETRGQIAPELVGKWCFLNTANGGLGTLTNTCITLNDDGSYEFALDDSGMAKAGSFFPGATIQQRDFGTWSAEGNTIYFKSTANGRGSLKFQKMNQPQNESTPLIVVEGISFASATPRDPW